MATKKKSTEIDIVQVKKGKVTYCLLGTTPIWLNRMSEKAKRQLLLPPKKKNAAARATTLKHDPMAEFRASPYRIADEKAPALLAMIATAFKKAMAGAALDLPGTSKAQIGRLMWVEGERIPLYGVPHLGMSVVRSADMNKTPDVRTRAVIPEWCAEITVSFVRPLLKESAVSNLLAMAGITQGIGDWRNEKGSGSYGGFEIVDPSNADFKRIKKTGGRKVQVAAMEDPDFYDEESRELYGWFEDEVVRRDMTEQLSVNAAVDDGVPPEGRNGQPPANGASA